MDKQFYGNITNTARTQFQFDRIYPNKKEMDDCCKSDGIYAGRYILIEYGENPTRNAVELIKRNNIFWYADFPTVQVIPNGTEEKPATIAPKTLCYVKEENNVYIFYETQDNDEKPFKEIYRYAFGENNYNTNWNIDYSEYGRGFDSTVWQKIYKNNKEEYIMIAELNTVVPNFTISTDAPSEIPTAPHFDENSTDLNYNLHMPASWDFRVKAAEEGAPSDETVVHRIRYDNDGNLLEEENEIEVRADIFYNKGAFVPYTYKEIEIISGEEEEYVSGKYYYKINNVYGLCKENYGEKAPYEIDFYSELNLSDPKTNYYTNTENLELIDLLREEENNWIPNTYYYIKNWEYEISLENYNPEEQYYKQEINENNSYIYSPILLTEESYKPNTYYILAKVYSLDESENFNENIVYHIKNGELYSPIDLVNKNVYELNKYYKFYEEYYVLDNSETKVENRQYYTTTDNINYVEINFTQKNYISNTYYYKDSDGNYLIDTSENGQEGVQYYIRSIPAVKEGVDKITILPTGQSGRLYNGHGEEGIKAANDIQEISINFPSVGKTIAEVWNLVYGKERNELIYGTPLYNQNMYNENGEPLYQTGIGNLSNFVGIINQINDLIGHNLIKINNENSIKIGNEIIIDGEIISYLNIDNVEDYIYWIESENKFYRLKLNLLNDGNYEYGLIPMGDINKEINTIYGALLEIQKALGTNEDENNASPDSLKGLLLKLKNIIEEQSSSIDFVEYDESLTMIKTKQWKHIDGTKLIRQWNDEFILATEAVELYKDYENYFATKKEFNLYKVEIVKDINNENYINYYIYTNDDKIIYKHPTEYDASLVYYNIEKLDETLDGFGGEEIDTFVVRALPTYWIINSEGFLEEYPVNNIFEDIIEYILYDIGHATPVASGNYNLDISLETEDNGYSALPKIEVNRKGHIYNPVNNEGIISKELFILPQAIVSTEEPANVPIGTLWYDTSTLS